MRSLLSAVLILGVAVSTATAQTRSPYAGWQARDIKGLSPQEIDDLSAGRGMSLALAAELNGYPGPRHVLDLDEHLALSGEQRAAMTRLFEEMQGEAQGLGADILRQEAALDSAFARGGLGEVELRRHLAELARLHGALRFVHLRVHLAARDLLSEAQVARYNALRGYTAVAPSGHDGAHRHQPDPH